LPDITCELRTAANCNAQGGVYQGDGVLCSELCDMLGGCCLPGGTCLASVTHDDCVAAGGIYQGTLQPCPPSCLGACCFDTGTICTNSQSETACEAAGGNWQGPGSTCATVNCRAICQIGTFQRIQSPGEQLVSSRDNLANDGFLKFDSLGGLRVLTRVYVEFNGTTIANMRILNLNPNDVGATALFSEFLALKELQTIVPPPPAGIPVVDLQDQLADGCGPVGGACLGFAEHAWLAWNDPNTPGVDTAKPILFEGTPFSSEVNAANFALFIKNGADDSFPVRVDGDSIFTVTTKGLFQFLQSPDHAEGYVKVIYEYGLAGACCHPCDGTCTPNLTASQCAAIGGIYQGDLSDCSPNPCIARGACCDPCDGTCVENQTVAQCSASGGIYQGNCSDCSPNPCIKRGACCDPCDGTCQENVTPADCVAQGGTYQGDCSDCSPNPCVGRGACCDPCDGTCVENQTAAQCSASGGIYQGNCSDCSPNPCIKRGACCDPCDGTCQENVTPADCAAQGGTYQGDCSDCSPNPCVGRGACCDPCDGTCVENQTAAQCSASGGIYQGNCTDCSPNPCIKRGACCDPCDGTCVENQTPAQCSASGGIYQGDCTDCSPNPCIKRGACCDPCDGTCQDNVTPADCLASGGIYKGDCTTCATVTCPPVGACCLQNGQCIEVEQADCVNQGGTFEGTCTECDDVRCEGACCYCDGTCQDGLTIDECETGGIDGGVWQGLDTTCGPDTCPPARACCLPNGECAVLIEECCVDVGGTWYPDAQTCQGIVCVPECRGGCNEKGSLIIWSKVDIRWDQSGNLLQDTFITLTNDYQADVKVQLYFINGDEPLEANGAERAHPGWNFVDNEITLTANQPTYWSAVSGNEFGVSPWTVLDPGTPPGRPATDGSNERMLRGFIVGWAVDNQGREIRWNQLAGEGIIVRYNLSGSAWEYTACAFQVPDVTAPHGGLLPTPGTLNLDGTEYCSPFDQLLLNFQASGSTAWSSNSGVLVDSDTHLTLHPISADLRLNVPTSGPPITKAHFDVWNENETKFSGAYRCIECWDQTYLRLYGVPNHFVLNNLQTDHGKARIDGIASPLCEDSEDFALTGVHARRLEFVGAGLTPVDIDESGGNLWGMGVEPAVIMHDPIGPPPDEAPVGVPSNPFEAADQLIEQIRHDLASRSAAATGPSRP